MKKLKGSYSIEAAVALPAIIITTALVIMVIKIIGLYSVLDTIITECATEVTHNTTVLIQDERFENAFYEKDGFHRLGYSYYENEKILSRYLEAPYQLKTGEMTADEYEQLYSQVLKIGSGNIDDNIEAYLTDIMNDRLKERLESNGLEYKAPFVTRVRIKTEDIGNDQTLCCLYFETEHLPKKLHKLIRHQSRQCLVLGTV